MGSFTIIPLLAVGYALRRQLRASVPDASKLVCGQHPMGLIGVQGELSGRVLCYRQGVEQIGEGLTLVQRTNAKDVLAIHASLPIVLAKITHRTCRLCASPSP